MSNIIIFGAGGQDGQYLTSYYEARGENVLGVVRSPHSFGRPMSVMDVSDFDRVHELISICKPKIVYQLAAVSSLNPEFSIANSAAIVAGTHNILEACRRSCPTAKIFIPGSGLQLAKDIKPSMYVIQRNAAIEMANFYRAQYGLRVYVGYLYNHESPLRGVEHVSMLVAAATRRIAAGSDERIAVGDPSVVKEWTFAGDVVRGMMLFLNQDDVHVTTIASGLGHSIDAWGVACFEAMGMTRSDWESRLTKIQGFIPNYRCLVHQEGVSPFWSDGAVLPGMVEMGWKPRVSFQELAGLMTSHLPNRKLNAC